MAYVCLVKIHRGVGGPTAQEADAQRFRDWVLNSSTNMGGPWEVSGRWNVDHDIQFLVDVPTLGDAKFLHAMALFLAQSVGVEYFKK